MKTKTIALAAALTVGLLAAACAPNDTPGAAGTPVAATTTGSTTITSGSAPEPSGSDDVVDARAYYDNYDESRGESAAAGTRGAAPYQVDAAEEDGGAAAPAPTRPPGGPEEPWPPYQEPGITDDNTFEDSGESPWVDTADTGTSTFGLDVDTGSFSVARTFVGEGHLPEPDSIRPEEWINSFDYGDAPPADGGLGLTVESATAPRGGDDTALVRIGVSTEELAAEDRPAANITFVVDTSGSMDIRERLGLVQSSLALLVNNLRPDDTIAIVTYGSEATPLLEPTPVSDADTIVGAIDRLEPGGSTNMEDGLRVGYRQARQSFTDDGVNVVVLASDGVANVGTTDADELTEEITRAGKDGISLVTVGYGMGNYNDVLMEQLADQGNGFYSYIDTFDEAERLFVDDLTPTLTTVAYDSKVQVNFDPKKVERFRLIGYQNRQLDDDDFTDDSVDAGELGAGHQVSALYEVQPADGVEPGTALGEVSIRWADTPGGKADQRDAELTWPTGEASDSLRPAPAVADTAELLRGDEVADDRGVSLVDLRDEADQLDQQGVDGADELLDFLDAAIEID